MFRQRQFLQLLQAFEDGSVLQQKQAIQGCLPNLEKLLVFQVRRRTHSGCLSRFHSPREQLPGCRLLQLHQSA